MKPIQRMPIKQMTIAALEVRVDLKDGIGLSFLLIKPLGSNLKDIFFEGSLSFRSITERIILKPLN